MSKTRHPGNKNYLLTGLITILPLFFTIYIIYFIFIFLSNISSPVLEPLFKNYFTIKYSRFFMVITSLTLTTAFIWTVGLIVTNFFGKKLFQFFEKYFERIPLVKNIYISIRRLLEYLITTKLAFRKVVLIEFPRKGIYSIGFITSEAWKEIQDITPSQMVNVFVPTTPNPTNGFLIMVPQEEIISLTMTTEEAIFFIMSGGIITPESDLAKKRITEHETQSVRS